MKKQLPTIWPLLALIYAATHIRFQSVRGRTVLFILMILANGCFIFCNTAFCQTAMVPAPWQQREFPGVVSPDQAPHKIEHGYILSYHAKVQKGPQNDAIYLHSLQNGQEIKTSFWIKGASTIWIGDVAVTQDKKLLVSGSFLPTGQSSPTNFVAQADFEGNVGPMLTLGSYEAVRVCGGPDGTIWTLGQDWSAEVVGSSYDLLRHYNGAGQLLKSFLSRGSLPSASLNMSTRLMTTGEVTGRSILKCGRESIGVYIGAASTWFEVQLSDGTAQQWGINPPVSGAFSWVTGLALLGEHQVYVSTRDRLRPDPTAARRLFKLDLTQPGVASWKPLVLAPSVTGGGESFGTLVGNDDVNLVYTMRQPSGLVASNAAARLFWSKP